MKRTVYFWLTFLPTIGLVLLLAILGGQFAWGELTTTLAAVAPLLLFCLIYVIGSAAAGRKIAAYGKRGEYEKIIGFARTMEKWYYGGKNGSSYHILAAAAYFQLNEDERFWQETEQVTDPRWAASKSYARAVFFVVHHDLPHAREQYAQCLVAARGSKWAAQLQRLDELLKVIDPSECEARSARIDRLLAQSENARIRKFLTEERDRSASAEASLPPFLTQEDIAASGRPAALPAKKKVSFLALGCIFLVFALVFVIVLLFAPQAIPVATEENTTQYHATVKENVTISADAADLPFVAVEEFTGELNILTATFIDGREVLSLERGDSLTLLLFEQDVASLERGGFADVVALSVNGEAVITPESYNAYWQGNAAGMRTTATVIASIFAALTVLCFAVHILSLHKSRAK